MTRFATCSYSLLKRNWLCDRFTESAHCCRGSGHDAAARHGSRLRHHGERLAAGNTAVALLANTLATGAGLAVLILVFGPISGAHFNPAVTISLAWERDLPWREVPAYLLAQVVGGFAGVAAADYMFNLPLFFASTTSAQERHSGSANSSPLV